MLISSRQYLIRNSMITFNKILKTTKRKWKFKNKNLKKQRKLPKLEKILRKF